MPYWQDKASSGRALRNELKNKGIKTVIPCKANEKILSDGRSQPDRDAYRNRNGVERCFGRLKNIVASPHVTTKRRGTNCRWLNWVVSICFTKDYAIKGHSLIFI